MCFIIACDIDGVLTYFLLVSLENKVRGLPFLFISHQSKGGFKCVVMDLYTHIWRNRTAVSLHFLKGHSRDQ